MDEGELPQLSEWLGLMEVTSEFRAKEEAFAKRLQQIIGKINL